MTEEVKEVKGPLKYKGSDYTLVFPVTEVVPGVGKKNRIAKTIYRKDAFQKFTQRIPKIHEIIYGSEPTKFFMDIDLKVTPGEMSLEQYNSSVLTQSIIKAKAALREVVAVEDDLNEVRMCHCHRDGKFSTHVVIPEVWFATGYQLGKFVKEKIVPNDIYIDPAVYPMTYETHRSLRLPFSYTCDEMYRMIPDCLVDRDNFESVFYRYCCVLREKNCVPTDFNMIEYGTIENKQVSKRTAENIGYLEYEAEKLLSCITESFTKEIEELKWRVENTGGKRMIPCIYAGVLHKSNGMYVKASNYKGGVQLSVLCLNQTCTKKGYTPLFI